MRYVFLEINVPTKATGFIYPRFEVEKALFAIGDTGFAGVNLTTSDMNIDLGNITHSVKDYDIADNGEVSAEFALLDTPKSRALRDQAAFWGKELDLTFSAVGTGIVSNSRIISDYTIIGFEVDK